MGDDLEAVDGKVYVCLDAGFVLEQERPDLVVGL